MQSACVKATIVPKPTDYATHLLEIGPYFGSNTLARYTAKDSVRVADMVFVVDNISRKL